MINTLLGNDLVINEDSCNLSCEYCLTGQSNLKEGHRLKLIFDPPKRDTYDDGTELAHRVDTVADRLRTTFDIPLLKVTGGEIFLVKGIMDFLEQEAPKHEVLVVQTNGVLVNEDHLERLRSFGNVVLQVSLDSHLHSGNSYRVQKPDLHEKVIRSISMILDSGIPCEIYSVLNDRSVSEMAEFAGWLKEFKNPPVYFPFPVRGPDAENFAVRPDQLHYIEEFVDRYDEFAEVLPPRAYFDRLQSFYREGKRTFRCHLPRLVVSTFSDGVVTPCPNIWFSDMGKVLEEDWDQTLEKVGETGLYKALLADRPRLSACHGCFTPWDTLSMYFDDEITLDELCSAPTYSPEPIRRMLETAKQDYVRGNA
ncbi:MAG TPA: radical SAM protein [Actinophytocola sp.]|uniref:radical SAM protein n=1 Tax=Actinophytocola sp. TaxID=1872138 RepID=UPI002DBC0373|nr:radical SAM protein [Actinophytocola sp.]HEU5473561.1 radical SAM protein [Actinophytocola sp.]